MTNCQELPVKTMQRHNRRTEFRKYFHDNKKCPLGLVDLDRLAEDTKIPWRTIVAYMNELRRLGYVTHRKKRYGKFGFQLDLRLWWKIK